MAEVTKELLKVEDVFCIKGRGVVLTGQTPGSDFELKKGDSIKIINPDGSKVQAEVLGVEKTTRQCFTPMPVSTIGVLIDISFRGSINPGSKVYFL